jgi:hypothetical protein
MSQEEEEVLTPDDLQAIREGIEDRALGRTVRLRG